VNHFTLTIDTVFALQIRKKEKMNILIYNSYLKIREQTVIDP